MLRARRKGELLGRRLMRRVLPLKLGHDARTEARSWSASRGVQEIELSFPAPDLVDVILPQGETSDEVVHFAVALSSSALRRAGFSRHVRWERVREDEVV